MKYIVTKEQTEKLMKAIPDKYHSALLKTIVSFNDLSMYQQESPRCHLFCQANPAVNLFTSRGLIHLEVDALDEGLFFKMDSDTNVVIHEVAL